MLHHRGIQNPYQNPQIFYKMLSSARFWILNLPNQLFSEARMMSIGMDRQLIPTIRVKLLHENKE
jgi:hypothetical protein